MWSSKRISQLEAKLAVLDRAQFVVEFDPSGQVLAANQTFLGAFGYGLNELAGKPETLLVDAAEAAGADYRSLWEQLRAGRLQAGQFRRLGKGGKEIWLEASYNPVPGKDGKPVRIVVLATDITPRKAEEAERLGQIAAIRRSQAVVSFSLDGNILDANENFLGLLGYSLAEIKGKPHSMFVEPTYRTSADHAAFWTALKRGDYQAGQYKRLGKGGREVWIQASYNPILDAAGRPIKVIKFATDITEQVKALANLQRLIDQNFGQIDQAVAHSAGESGAAVRAIDATSGNVQSMAAAAEELAGSVAEIADSMAKSRTATDSAFESAKAAGDFTKRLGDAASSMGGIVGLIQNIAGQINLLALNATIESARAGEAGRGFAVVAQEVKNLASQAAKATEQITGEISGVQTISNEVVRALESIGGSVAIMRDHVVATSAAVEEQSAVTRDMSSNMQAAARDMASISKTIASISGAVSKVGVAVSTTREAAKVLAR